MKNNFHQFKFLLSLCLLSIGFLSCESGKKMDDQLRISYPETKATDHVDEYFGVEVKDPYRWLENDTSSETSVWVDAQNEVTFGYLDKIPFKGNIRERLEKLYDYEKYSAPSKEGEKYFFYKNDGLQNQAVMYVQESLDGEPKEFLDPNKFSEDGTVSLAGTSFTKSGKLMAYQVSESGSDWRTIKVLDVETGEELPDTIQWAKFTGVSWKGDEGFFYSMYEKPKEGKGLSSMNENHRVFYHKLGTPQEEDEFVFGGEKLGARYVSASVTEDQKYAFFYPAIRTYGNALYYKDLSKPNSPIKPIVEGYDFQAWAVHNEGDKIFLMTDHDAPNSKIVTLDLTESDLGPSSWKELVPEKEDVLEEVSFAGGKMFLNYLKDASNKIYQYDLAGKMEREVSLPAIGSAAGFDGKKEDTEVFYYFTSFTYPTTIYSYDIASGGSKIFRQPEVEFDPDQYTTRQVFYESKDGTKVPMFIVHKKGLQLDGNNPTMMYGYGGFNVSLTPSFNPTRVFWLENGGIFAMPNIRGGGEYGNAWHQAGTKLQKQNVFDDFIAAAEFLIAEKYTSSEKLGIFGGSNGGLLVGACMTQRPELFKVAIPAVGVLDMLRYHQFTAGAGWVYDYGCADSSDVMFEYLKSYSPLHNIKEGVEYPATLVTTADHDDRVVPAHSFKFISELQKKHQGNNPVLIRIEKKAGHGAGKPTSKILDEWADMYAFMYANMGVEPFGGL